MWGESVGGWGTKERKEAHLNPFFRFFVYKCTYNLIFLKFFLCIYILISILSYIWHASHNHIITNIYMDDIQEAINETNVIYFLILTKKYLLLSRYLNMDHSYILRNLVVHTLKIIIWMINEEFKRNFND